MPSLCRATGVPGTSDNSSKDQDIQHREFSFSDENFAIIDAPENADWRRWGMLDDRKSTRLYCFKQGSNTELFQFLFDGCQFVYDGHSDYSTINIDGLSTSADVSHIGMLSTPNFEEVEGYNNKTLPVPNNYHVYMLNTDEAQPADNKRTLYQYIWERGTSNLEPNGITNDKFTIGAFPDDIDWSRWSMNYDSNRYQLALRAYVFTAFQQGSNKILYQGRYDNYGSDEHPITEYRYSEQAELIDAPDNIGFDSFATVFDGIQTHIYFLTEDT